MRFTVTPHQIPPSWLRDTGGIRWLVPVKTHTARKTIPYAYNNISIRDLTMLCPDVKKRYRIANSIWIYHRKITIELDFKRVFMSIISVFLLHHFHKQTRLASDHTNNIRHLSFRIHYCMCCQTGHTIAQNALQYLQTYWTWASMLEWCVIILIIVPGV